MRKILSSAILALAIGGAGAAAAQPSEAWDARRRVTLEAETARVAADRVEVADQKNFSGGRGVALKPGAASHLDSPKSEPDLVFSIQAPEAGRYWIHTHAAVNADGEKAMRAAAGKTGSLRMLISVGDSFPRSRVVFTPWSKPDSCKQAIGKYNLTGKPEDVRIWLPEGVRLDCVRISPYVPPAVPEAAASYKPAVVPPKSHPRIWVNADSLPRVRANLDKGENGPFWKQMRENAAKPFPFAPPADEAVPHNAGLESAAMAKAFVYLMNGDAERGREAVALARGYLSRVEFDNLLDITREIGRAIYAGALVYDWCNDLMSDDDRLAIRQGMMRLAEDMECGWPPFRQMIVNGHGNERQINRDLLSMSIAIYDEDPEPYRYCSYRILEELVPMRAFEYQSPRHNQGSGYGPFRFTCDMHAAWLMRRMSGKPVFDPNIERVYYSWIYTRLPSGQLFANGDYTFGKKARIGAIALLCASYANDPVIKADVVNLGGLKADPMLTLLLNDPDMAPVPDFQSLPLTLDFGPVLGAMVARTGWNIGRNIADVVVEMKGGGYHFGNHQHSDAGSFQVYYRGMQVADLGQYHFYGTPYDSHFAKRSVAHSLMLAVDPDEEFPSSSRGGPGVNDGGTKYQRSCPLTPQQVTTDPKFATGKKVSASFGPSAVRPFFSYFSIDLTSAYSDKIKDYVRSFCFLNLGDDKTPAVLIVRDVMTTAKPEFRKYWQLNTFQKPDVTPDGVMLHNNDLGLGGKVHVRMLRPRPDERTVQILTGPDAMNVFGRQFEAPNPAGAQATGSRVLFSPKTASATDVFLTVMPMFDANAKEIPVAVSENDRVFVLTLADRVVVLGKTAKLLDQGFEFDVPEGGDRQVLFAGLEAGPWSIARKGGETFNAVVEKERNTAFVVCGGGHFTVRHAAAPGGQVFRAKADFMPRVAPSLANRIFLDGRMLDAPPARKAEHSLLVSVRPLMAAFGGKSTERAGKLLVEADDRRAEFQAGSAAFQLNGCELHLPDAAVRDGDQWFLPDSALAGLMRRDLRRDADANCVEFRRHSTPLPKDILWAQARDQAEDPTQLRLTLADIPSRRGYWAVQGQDVGFDLALVRNVRIKGVGVRWYRGAARKAKFAIETSVDGTTWKRVFEGSSSGKTNDMETYAFAPHDVRYVRFVGFGNTSNNWNSLVHFELLLDE